MKQKHLFYEFFSSHRQDQLSLLGAYHLPSELYTEKMERRGTSQLTSNFISQLRPK